MKRLPNKVYFIQYGYVFSFELGAAIDVAYKCSRMENVDFGDYGRLLKTKAKTLQGKPLTYHTLDNTESDWLEIIEELTNVLHMKAKFI